MASPEGSLKSIGPPHRVPLLKSVRRDPPHSSRARFATPRHSRSSPLLPPFLPPFGQVLSRERDDFSEIGRDRARLSSLETRIAGREIPRDGPATMDFSRETLAVISESRSLEAMT